MGRRRFLVCLAALFWWSLFWFGCNASPNQPLAESFDLSDPWPLATPAEVGMQAQGLRQAAEKAAAIPRSLSLLVVKNGRLVLEEYFHGNHADSLNDVRSVTKSVVSTLVAIALQHGFIGNLDETVGDYLPEDVADLSPAQAAISIRHLLTMTSGFLWNEIGGPAYNNWILSGEHIQHLLDQPFAAAPGASFTYNSAAVHLLGAVLQEAVGMPLPEFANRYLFSKIGISRSRWEELNGRYVNGGAGLDLRPRDLARLGQLYLQGGVDGPDQVLPRDWVNLAKTPRFSWRATFGSLKSYTYGFLWWIEEGQPEPAYFAWGYGGQFIYVVPDLQLVVVATANWRLVSQDGGANALEQAVLDIIINDVIPAAR